MRATQDAARKALAEAKSVDEVKHILDIAIAMAAYSQQAKSRKWKLTRWKYAFVLRAVLMKCAGRKEETVGLATGGEHGGRATIDGLRNNPSNARPTLSEQGIDKNLAHHARILGALSDEQFEKLVADARVAKRGGARGPLATAVVARLTSRKPSTACNSRLRKKYRRRVRRSSLSELVFC